jgi:hypothetical protein
MPEFIPGLKLSETFYLSAVKPILDEDFPGLEYAAALVGACSDVLGYDDAISTDHHWGPRLLLFLLEGDYEALRARISEILSAKLPYTFQGYSTNFGEPDGIGVRLMSESDSGPVNHMVEFHTVRAFVKDYLGVDPYDPVRAVDWLTFPEEKLLRVTGGKVFHDEPGELSMVRGKFSYYPDDVWFYMLASQWQKVSQEEAFVGRCGDVGDELGSRVIAARIVHQLMRLCFLMERAYAPYSKWFGTAFSRLQCAPVLAPVLSGVLSAETWRERERHLSEAYRIVAEKHNALCITEPMSTEVSNYHTRPYLVIHAGRFVDGIKQRIQSEEVRNILPMIGSVDQVSDSSDLLDSPYPQLCRRLTVLYGS